MTYYVLIWETESYELETMDTAWVPLVSGLVYLLESASDIRKKTDALLACVRIRYLYFIQMDSGMPHLE